MEKLNRLKELRDKQGEKGTIDQGDYMIGLYNGLELAIAMIEDREPMYKECEKKEAPSFHPLVNHFESIKEGCNNGM